MASKIVAFLCRFGLHQWVETEAVPSQEWHVHFITEACSHCSATRTRIINQWDQMSGI